VDIALDKVKNPIFNLFVYLVALGTGVRPLVAVYSHMSRQCTAMGETLGAQGAGVGFHVAMDPQVGVQLGDLFVRLPTQVTEESLHI
jgi:hypothetical protein